MAPVDETELVDCIGKLAKRLIRDARADTLSCNDPLGVSRIPCCCTYVSINREVAVPICLHGRQGLILFWPGAVGLYLCDEYPHPAGIIQPVLLPAVGRSLVAEFERNQPARLVGIGCCSIVLELRGIVDAIIVLTDHLTISAVLSRELEEVRCHEETEHDAHKQGHGQSDIDETARYCCHAPRGESDQQAEDKAKEQGEHDRVAQEVPRIMVGVIEKPLVDAVEAVDIVLDAAQRPVFGCDSTIAKGIVDRTGRDALLVIDGVAGGVDGGPLRDALEQYVVSSDVGLTGPNEMDVSRIGLVGCQFVLVPHHGDVANVFFKARCDALDSGALARIGHVVGSNVELLVGKCDLGTDGQIIALVDGDIARIVAGARDGTCDLLGQACCCQVVGRFRIDVLNIFGHRLGSIDAGDAVDGNRVQIGIRLAKSP